MMKRFKYIIYLAAVVLLSACADEYDFGNLDDIQFSKEPHCLSIVALGDKVKLEAAENSKGKTGVYSENTRWALQDVPTSWLTASPSTGTESTDITLTATANLSGYESRFAVLSLVSLEPDFVCSKEISVCQTTSAPIVELSEESLVAHWKGETLTVDVKSNIDWTVKVPESCKWITVKTTANKIMLDIPRNLGDEREATLDVRNKKTGARITSISVRQTEVNVTSNIKDVTFECGEGKQVVPLDTYAYLSDIKATTSASWIATNLTQVKEGLVNLEIAALPNKSIQERSAVVYIKLGDEFSSKYSVTVIQKGIAFSVKGKVRLFQADGSPESKLTVISNTDWQVNKKDEWVEVTPSSGNAGETEITVSATANPTFTRRFGTVELGTVDYPLEAYLDIEQLGQKFELQTSLSFDWEASKQKIQLVSPLPWTAEVKEDWISMSQLSGQGGDSVTVSVQANIGEKNRIGTINVTSADNHKTIRVYQNGQYLHIGEASGEIGVRGGKISLEYKSTVGAKDSISYQEGPSDWITVSHDDTYHQYVLDVAENPSSKARSASFYILPTMSLVAGPSKDGVKLPINQKGRDLQVTVKTISFLKGGGKSETYKIIADGAYTVTKDEKDDWYEVSYDANTHSFSVVAAQNTSETDREGTLTLALTGLPKGETLEKKVVISQVQKNGIADKEDFGEDEDWTPKNEK